MLSMQPSDTMHNPLLYDAEMEGWNADVPFWERIIDEYQPRTVLELACGTGRLTLPLAAKGRSLRSDFQVLGLDVSKPALLRATEKRAALNPDIANAVTFIEGDMRSFDLGQAFDLIIIGFNSFAHIHDAVEQTACLQAVRRHLVPEGHFGLDLVSPYCLWHRSDLFDSPPLRVMHNHPVPSLGISRFVQYAAHSFNLATQTYRLHYVNELYYDDGRSERVIEERQLHIYFPAELELLLSLSGFSPVSRYGTYLEEPFHQMSWQYLWIMETAERLRSD